MMKGIILAGGEGKRLGLACAKISKPEIVINGKRTLDVVIQAFKNSSWVNEFVVCSNFSSSHVTIDATSNCGINIIDSICLLITGAISKREFQDKIQAVNERIRVKKGESYEFVFAFSDIPFITGKSIDCFVTKCRSLTFYGNYLVVPAVPKYSFAFIKDLYPPHFYPSEEGDWAHGNIIYLKLTEPITGVCFKELENFFSNRMFSENALSGYDAKGLYSCADRKTLIPLIKILFYQHYQSRPFFNPLRKVIPKPYLVEYSAVISALLRFPATLLSVEDVRLGIEYDTPHQLSSIILNYSFIDEEIRENEAAITD